ncbi:MAG: hypothetical protein WD834_05770 [Actinomycetota bacterium]
MKRSSFWLMTLVVTVVASVATVAAIARPAPRPPVPPNGPAVPADSGAGELLLVVLGGVYPTRAEAVRAADGMAFGDVQGYYVAPVGQFEGFQQQAGLPGDFALVSVFRTREGAESFVEVVRGYGHPATILPERVRSLGGVYAGLGQEANPDGSGPLTGPIAESLP